MQQPLKSAPVRERFASFGADPLAGKPTDYAESERKGFVHTMFGAEARARLMGFLERKRKLS